MTTKTGISLIPPGIDHILRKLEPSITHPILRGGLETIGQMAEPEFVRRLPTFSGRTRRSVRTKIDRRNPLPAWATIGPRSPIAVLIEKGARPHMPPIDPASRGGKRFRRYVQRVLKPQAGVKGKLSKQQAIDSAAFRLARAIARRGIPARPFVQATAAAVRPRVIGVMNRMKRQLEQAWRTR